MRMRTGRLKTGYFKEMGRELASRYLRWNNQILRSTGVLTNATWFSPDNETDKASMVNQADVDGRVLWELAEYLEGDEAVAVVLEWQITNYWQTHEWRPTAADGPLYIPPPGAVTGGMLSGCTLQIPLAEAVKIAGYLVVARRVYILGHAPVLDMNRVEVVPADVVPALFADA